MGDGLAPRSLRRRLKHAKNDPAPETVNMLINNVLTGDDRDDMNSSSIMMQASQTPREVDMLRSSSFVGPKKLVNIGFWNVRTMFQASKVAQVAKEFRCYNLDILGISECR